MRQDVYPAPTLGGFEATRRDSTRVTARFFRPQRPPDRASPLAENWLGQTCRIVPRRLRWLAWALQLAVALAGGWIWFGNARRRFAGAMGLPLAAAQGIAGGDSLAGALGAAVRLCRHLQGWPGLAPAAHPAHLSG